MMKIVKVVIALVGTVCCLFALACKNGPENSVYGDDFGDDFGFRSADYAKPIDVCQRGDPNDPDCKWCHLPVKEKR